MNGQTVVAHEFVKTIPNELEERTLYVSLDYATVVHKCCCGCGREVVTPLSPTDWQLTYDGVSISLYPSIGNWSFECQSHYWLEHGEIRWGGRWSRERIALGRAGDRRVKEAFYDGGDAGSRNDPIPTRHSWARGLWSLRSRVCDVVRRSVSVLTAPLRRKR